MAQNDGDININTKINTDGITTGIGKITAALNKFSKNGILSAMGDLGAAVTGVGTAFTAATAVVKKANDTIKDLENSYKVQARAETQLEVAAKNNPYLNGESVQALEEYAGSLQSVSTYGDEQLIPFMAELASAGRTQTEIMDVMNAAVNIAASGEIDLGSAVRSLNMSFSGQVGQLGKLVPQLKNMTTEQLANGAAVKTVARNFDGMAEKMAESLGTSEQLANAWGDLKEEMGAPFEKSMTPLRKFFTELISGWASAAKARREYNEAKEKQDKGETSASNTSILVENAKKELALYEGILAEYSDENKVAKKIQESRGYLTKESVEKYKKQIQEKIEAEKKHIESLQAQLDAERQTEAAEAASAAAADKNATAQKALDTYNATITAKEKEIELRRRSGEVISKEAEELEMANTMLQAYNQLIKDGGGTISGNLEREQSKLDEMGLLKSLGGVESSMSESDALNAQMSTLEQYYQAVQNSAYITAEKKKEYEEEYTQKHDELVKKREELDKEEATARYQSHFDALQKIADKTNEYTNTFADMVQSAVSLAQDQVDAESEYKLAQLELDYNNGIITEEEYNKQKEKIEKESAEKTYQLEMYNWETQILQATASGALAVVNALSTAGNIYAGIAMAAVATAMTGIQLGTLIAAKPVKPSFATGGIVPGASYTGDNVAINANSREAVLTLSQQKRLLALAEGSTPNGSGAVLNMPISIENSVSDTAQVDIEKRLDQIKIMVRQQTKDDIKSGLYNSELMTAQGSFRGRKYTN